MNFHCTVSTSRTRRPTPIVVDACDEADAAFSASLKCQFPVDARRAVWVHRVALHRDSYRVTNGFTTYLVTVVPTT